MNSLPPFFLLGTLVLAAASSRGQSIVLTDTTAYTQNFDTLANTAGSTTNTLALAGWHLTETGGGARDNEQYAVDTGAAATGDTYSYGSAGSTERALGALQSGTLVPIIGAAFTNATGATITDLAIAYTGEQWRLGAVVRSDRLDFQYSVDAASLTSGSWINGDQLDFTSPVAIGPTGALDGNAAASRAMLSTTISGLALANGSTVWIRWVDSNATGADDGLAVDDFSLAAIVGIPEPSTYALALGGLALGLAAWRRRR